MSENSSKAAIVGYQSSFTGATIDALLSKVQSFFSGENGGVSQEVISQILQGLTGEQIMNALSTEQKQQIAETITGEKIIQKMNSISAEKITFSKKINCSNGAGKNV